MSRTEAGFWVAAQPCLALAADVSPAEVGTAVATALSASGGGLPNPRPGGPLPIQPLVELAGVKSWPAFAKGVRLVAVRLEGADVSVEPKENRGGREGFVAIPDVAIASAPVGDVEQIGRAVLAGLAAGS